MRSNSHYKDSDTIKILEGLVKGRKIRILVKVVDSNCEMNLNNLIDDHQPSTMQSTKIHSFSRVLLTEFSSNFVKGKILRLDNWNQSEDGNLWDIT